MSDVREQQGASSGHFFEREHVAVSARTAEMPTQARAARVENDRTMMTAESLIGVYYIIK